MLKLRNNDKEIYSIYHFSSKTHLITAWTDGRDTVLNIHGIFANIYYGFIQKYPLFVNYFDKIIATKKS